MRRVTSFKHEYRQASARAATPPPPVYEPLSPVLAPTEPSRAHPAGTTNTRTASLSGADHGNGPPAGPSALGKSTRALGGQTRPAVTYEPGLRSAQPPPHLSLAQPSPIEALADVAMISQHTSPAYVGLSRHAAHLAASPMAASLPVGERAPTHAFARDLTYPYTERPAKRARSEVYGSPQYGQAHSRPATSHISHRPYNVEHMADSGIRMPYNTNTNTGDPSDRLSDAQLLLDFFNVSTQTVQSPPSTAKRWSVSQSAPAEQQSQQAQQMGEPTSPYVAPLPLSDPNVQHTQSAGDMKLPLETLPDAAPTDPTAQTHPPPDEAIHTAALPATQSSALPEEPKAKKQQGWPKGKARGARSSTATATSSRRKKTTPKPKGAPSASTAGASDQTQSPLSLPTEHLATVPLQSSLAPATLAEPAHTSPTQARRHSFSTPTLPLPNNQPLSMDSRAKSLPLGPQAVPPVPVNTSGQPANASTEPELICAACNSSESETKVGDGEQWIGCDGCKEWYHYPCAGFNSEREVREVNKFYCEPCRPKFGETTSRSTDAHWAYSSNMVQRFVNPSEPTQLLTTLV